MVRLEKPILMRAELLQFSLKELAFFPGNGLFVQDKNVRDVVVVDLLISQLLVL